MQHEEKLCLQAGFDRFMGKPVDKQEFQKVLHEMGVEISSQQPKLDSSDGHLMAFF